MMTTSNFGSLAAILLCGLAGCGLADTATGAAAGGAAKARESEQLKDVPAKVEARLGQADREARERLDAAERDGR